MTEHTGSVPVQEDTSTKIFQVQPLDSDVRWTDLEVKKEMDSKTECISVHADKIQERNNFKDIDETPSYRGGFLWSKPLDFYTRNEVVSLKNGNRKVIRAI